MSTNETTADVVGNEFDPDAIKQAETKMRDLKKANLRSVFGSGVGRLSMVAFGGAVLLMIVIGGYKMFAKADAPVMPQANNAVLNSPGAQGADAFASSEHEAQMRRQLNERQAEEARRSGSPYMAPPVLQAEDHEQKLGANDLAKADAKPTGTPEEQRIKMQQQSGTVQDPSVAVAQQRRDQQYAELKQLREQLKKDEVMPQVLVAMGLGWKGEKVMPFSTSAYTVPDRSKTAQAATAQVPANTSTVVAATQKTRLFQAGDACYGQLDYGINTDNPGTTVIATMSECKGVKTAKVLGKYEVKEQNIALSFDKLSIPGKGVIPIQAIAINEDTWGTGMADDVDNHYLRRFGTTALAALLAGFGKAAQIPVGTSTTTGYTTAAQTTTIQEPMTPARQAKIALGEVGQQVGEQFKAQAATVKPTIKVYGPKDGQKGIGIVFVADVYEEKK